MNETYGGKLLMLMTCWKSEKVAVMVACDATSYKSQLSLDDGIIKILRKPTVARIATT